MAWIRTRQSEFKRHFGSRCGIFPAPDQARRSPASGAAFSTRDRRTSGTRRATPRQAVFHRTRTTTKDRGLLMTDKPMTVFCVMCRNEIPEKRVNRGSHFSAKIATKRPAQRRSWRASKNCRLCGRAARSPKKLKAVPTEHKPIQKLLEGEL